MHNLVPHFIQDNFKAGKFQGQFPAVGLFLDISGFSTMTVALMAHSSPNPLPGRMAGHGPFRGKGKSGLG